jgi:hypothetical protein
MVLVHRDRHRDCGPHGLRSRCLGQWPRHSEPTDRPTVTPASSNPEARAPPPLSHALAPSLPRSLARSLAPCLPSSPPGLQGPTTTVTRTAVLVITVTRTAVLVITVTRNAVVVITVTRTAVLGSWSDYHRDSECGTNGTSNQVLRVTSHDRVTTESQDPKLATAGHVPRASLFSRRRAVFPSHGSVRHCA